MGRLPTSTQAPITAVIGTSTPQAVGQPSSTAQPSNSPRVEQWLNESPSGLSRPMTRSHTAAPGLVVASSAATMPITTPVPGSVPTPVASGPFQVPPTIPQPSEGTFGLPSSTPLHVALATQGLTRIPTPNTGVSASPPTSHHPAINAAVSAAARIAAAHAPLLDSTGPTPVAQPVTAEAVASGGSAGIPRQLTFNNGSLHRTVTGEASTSQPHHSSPALVGGQRTHPRPIPPVAGGSSNPMTTPAPGPQVPGVRPTDTPTDPWVAVYRYIDGIIENRLAAITGNIPRHVQSAVINYTDRFGSRLSSLDSLTEQLRVAFNQLVEQNTSLRLEEIERKLLEATPRNMEPAEPTAPPPTTLGTREVSFADNPPAAPDTVDLDDSRSEVESLKEQLAALQKRLERRSSSKRKKSRRRRNDTDTDDRTSVSSSSTNSDDEKAAAISSAETIGLGPTYPGLQEIVPADERFKGRVSYRRYRLRITSSRQGRSVSKNLGLQSRRFLKLFQNSYFDGGKPLAIIEFLSAFKKRCDQNGVSEGMAVELLPDLLKGNALSFYKRNVSLEANREGAATSYPAAVNLLLETYATNHHIEQALCTLDHVDQTDLEDERQYGERLQEADRACGGGICDEKSLINRAVRGLHRSIKQTIAYRHAENPFSRFKSVIDAAYVAGCTYRVGQESSRQRVSSIPRTTDRLPVRAASPARVAPSATRRVNLVSHETTTPLSEGVSGTTASNALLQDAGYDAHTSSEYDSKTSPTVPSADSSLDPSGVNAIRGYVPHPSQVHLPRDARPKSFQQPGWVDRGPRTPDLESDICYKCFGRGHRRSSCSLRAPVDQDPSVLKANALTIFNNWGQLSEAERDTLFKQGVTPFESTPRSRSPSPRPLNRSSKNA